MTRTYEEYYNVPEIVNEPKPLREVHAARLLIYDRTKDMDNRQITEYYRHSAETAAHKYGFKLVDRAY
jgi:hypothetical protein